MSLFGGIEAGGTKVVCAVGTSPDDVRARTVFPTTSPEETIHRVLEFFRAQHQRVALAAIGIGSFGPVELHPDSPYFGSITSTPKAGWQNVDMAGPLRRAFGLPVGFDTDVNAAALGEHTWGAARGLDTFIYVTVGTGIGGGGMAAGKLLHGMLHPEMGHIRIAHDRQSDSFDGVCPYHGDCWEGLATGPAMEARWGEKAENLPADHRAWQLEARYLALGVTNLICAISPQRIILGGGVMRQRLLFDLIRRETAQLLNGYIRTKEVLERMDEFIVAPQLGDDAGVLGAIALAANAAMS